MEAPLPAAPDRWLRFGQITGLPAVADGLGVTPAVVKLDMQTALLGLNYRF